MTGNPETDQQALGGAQSNKDTAEDTTLGNVLGGVGSTYGVSDAKTDKDGEEKTEETTRAQDSNHTQGDTNSTDDNASDTTSTIILPIRSHPPISRRWSTTSSFSFPSSPHSPSLPPTQPRSPGGLPPLPKTDSEFETPPRVCLGDCDQTQTGEWRSETQSPSPPVVVQSSPPPDPFANANANANADANANANANANVNANANASASASATSEDESTRAVKGPRNEISTVPTHPTIETADEVPISPGTTKRRHEQSPAAGQQQVETREDEQIRVGHEGCRYALGQHWRMAIRRARQQPRGVVVTFVIVLTLAVLLLWLCPRLCCTDRPSLFSFRDSPSFTRNATSDHPNDNSETSVVLEIEVETAAYAAMLETLTTPVMLAAGLQKLSLHSPASAFPDSYIPNNSSMLLIPPSKAHPLQRIKTLTNHICDHLQRSLDASWPRTRSSDMSMNTSSLAVQEHISYARTLMAFRVASWESVSGAKRGWRNLGSAAHYARQAAGDMGTLSRLLSSDTENHLPKWDDRIRKEEEEVKGEDKREVWSFLAEVDGPVFFSSSYYHDIDGYRFEYDFSPRSHVEQKEEKRSQEEEDQEEDEEEDEEDDDEEESVTVPLSSIRGLQQSLHVPWQISSLLGSMWLHLLRQDDLYYELFVEGPATVNLGIGGICEFCAASVEARGHFTCGAEDLSSPSSSSPRYCKYGGGRGCLDKKTDPRRWAERNLDKVMDHITNTQQKMLDRIVESKMSHTEYYLTILLERSDLFSKSDDDDAAEAESESLLELPWGDEPAVIFTLRHLVNLDAVLERLLRLAEAEEKKTGTPIPPMKSKKILKREAAEKEENKKRWWSMSPTFRLVSAGEEKDAGEDALEALRWLKTGPLALQIENLIEAEKMLRRNCVRMERGREWMLELVKGRGWVSCGGGRVVFRHGRITGEADKEEWIWQWEDGFDETMEMRAEERRARRKQSEEDPHAEPDHVDMGAADLIVTCTRTMLPHPTFFVDLLDKRREQFLKLANPLERAEMALKWADEGEREEE